MTPDPASLTGADPEPPTGSVVMLVYPNGLQEVWEAVTEDLGAWYSSASAREPHTWRRLCHRAATTGATLTLMVPGDVGTLFALGWEMGRAALAADLTGGLSALIADHLSTPAPDVPGPVEHPGGTL